ncbi:MAG: hypothetical protein EZS28_015771 [Streblomastix strix]|uniref:Right handed beta helix domain-containing protein n=1 Tax=Streblomastix strix TaxID=222440 RepID=A0A5J4W185_9EUKA|nr:MAG: hypothetical protein EZS28_015771 [Streblomastix strix]
MNAGHLKLSDSTFLGEAYTSTKSAIRAYSTCPSTIDVEGVLFKGQVDGQGTNGGSVYVDMRQFDIQISFKRCIFIGNKADYGSNVFIRYASHSQMINKNSFIGCTTIVENSYESDIMKVSGKIILKCFVTFDFPTSFYRPESINLEEKN